MWEEKRVESNLENIFRGKEKKDQDGDWEDPLPAKFRNPEIIGFNKPREEIFLNKGVVCSVKECREIK